ncbi:hypothetical protein [Streptomyces avicenniae]|uniref:hypothetical protein n=1 Tax=Streptomyces avicenniae TaxID=500153 RepID=UPI00069B0621|nr:hypothetical protein [Streptomyces avicenniae]
MTVTRVRMCDGWTYAPARLAPLLGEHAEDLPPGLVRCELGAHASGPHHVYVADLDGRETGAIWAAWQSGDPLALTVLPDCPCKNGQPGVQEEVCCFFAGHSGPCSWDVRDPRSP